MRPADPGRIAAAVITVVGLVFSIVIRRAHAYL